MLLLLILVILWISISGSFSLLPFVPGLVFIFFGIILYKKTKKASNFEESFSVILINFSTYIFYMAKEIFLSNIFVAKTIFKNNSSPQVFEIENSFKTHSGVTIFSNSVTLTPGTIVLYADENKIIIHSLTKEGKYSVLDYKMYNKVIKLEKTSKKNLIKN